MKRGGYLKRHTPLKRTGGLRRTGRLRPVNPERRAQREERNFGYLAVFIRELECVCCIPGTQRTPTQACHVKSRGAGGHAWNDDGTSNLLPMCHTHHAYQHSHGWNALVSSIVDPFEVPDGREWAEKLAADIGHEFECADK